ncbi:MAG TPA: TraR/DksA family transcriptional regulator [Arenicellales bacterium]|nr:TraR/DksA family transcriptional regulator [Arenicellales bacterium]
MQDIRQRLLKKRDELEQRLEGITRDVRHEDNPLSGDWEEQAVQRESDEVLDALGNETRRELELIRQALARMDSGEYPYCAECGEEINRARLESLPYTQLCVKCAQKRERAN